MEYDIFEQSEIKFYTEVYNYLKQNFKYDSSGNISSSDVITFLAAASKLPREIIDQIDDVAGSPAKGWYNEKQLFLALKLVSAAQQNIPISSQTPLQELDLPLPFLFTNNNTQYDIQREDMKERDSPSPNLIQLSDSDCPVPLREEDGYQMMVSDDIEEDENVEGFYSEPTSNFTSQSPSAYSPASDSPTPTNSVHEKNWSQSHKSQWPNLGNEEHHQLLGTEEDSSDRHSSEEREVDEENEQQKDKKELQTNEVASEPEEEEDVWNMTEEQQQYYTNHFISMQPDVKSLIPGNIAKQFFEKSKLPVVELSNIWQLCDVSKDGALSLEEFFAAMHLVVLRRNNIPLPDKLPPSLMPKSCRWTKFIDSPTSTLSSPGPKPVNFDFQNSAVEKNPQILHPKPVRVTPEARNYDQPEDEGFGEEKEKITVAERHVRSSKEISSNSPFSTNDIRKEQSPPNQSSRGVDCLSPSLDKSSKFLENENYGPKSLPFHISHPIALPLKRDLPPPPPPRPNKTHTRSSSLDLNKLSNTMITPGNTIATASPSNNHLQQYTLNSAANKDKRISKISEDAPDTSSRSNFRTSGNDPMRTSAFEVYKKPQETSAANTKDSSSEDEDTGKNSSNSSAIKLSDKRNILSTLYTKREKNAILQRLNSELNQELAEIIEERIGLEFQLEQMKHLS